MGKKKGNKAGKKIMTQSSVPSKVMSSTKAVRANLSMLPAATASIPKPYFNVGHTNDGVVIRGCDALRAVDVPAIAAYTNCVNLMISPQSLGGGTRLARFADMYERYRFRRLRFHHQSASGSSAVGSFVMTYDRDPSDPTPPATFQGLQEYLGHADSVVYNVWQTPTLDCSLGPCPQDGLFTNMFGLGDERLAVQGQLYIANASIMDGTGGHGILWMEYEVELWQPQLSTGAASTTASSSAPSVTDSLANGVAVGPIQLIQKAVSGSLRTGFHVPPGTWEFVMQALNASSGSAQPLVMGLSQMGTQGSALITSLLSSPTAALSTNQMARSRLEITDPEGGFAWATTTSGNAPISTNGVINSVRSLIL